jgi:outer membrane protein assembly factor BamB
MKISNILFLVAPIIAIWLLTFLSGCGTTDNDNDEEVTPSERQLYVFSVPGVGFSVGPPTLVNDLIYIGTSVNLTYLPSTSNYFYKLDETLNKVWEYPLGNKQLRGAASLDNLGNIYFVVDSGRTCLWDAKIKLYSLDNNATSDGQKKLVLATTTHA